MTVDIPGKAWQAEPIGADPHYKPDTAGLRHIKTHAKRRRCGRGEIVTLTGNAADLARLAEWFQSDGEVWLSQCDTPEGQADARACLEAAKRIKAAIKDEAAIALGVELLADEYKTRRSVGLQHP